MGCIGTSGVYGSQDAAYFRQIEAEKYNLSGLVAEYYSLNRGVNVDPLYNEPDNDPLYGGDNPTRSPIGTPQTSSLSWNFSPDILGGDSPLLIPCGVEYVEFENRQPSVRPEGKIVEYDAIMRFASLSWECEIEKLDVAELVGRTPKEGDVVYVFEEWWDVVKAGRAGNVLGTSVTVGYSLELKKRTQFTPDRKIAS